MCQLYKLSFIADVHKEEKSGIYRAWYMQRITSTGILRTHPLPIRGTTALVFLMQEVNLQ